MVERPEGYWKRYYAEHRDQRIALSVAYQQAHAEQRREYMRDWTSRNQERIREYRLANADKRNARRREQYANDPEHRERKKSEAREWQRANPDKRLAQVLRPFGITVEQYRDLLSQQDGGCAICRAPLGDLSGRRLAVDHCHDTGRVRGLLCGACNLGLGKFGDDPERLERAALYLRSCQRDTPPDQ